MAAGPVPAAATVAAEVTLAPLVGRPIDDAATVIVASSAQLMGAAGVSSLSSPPQPARTSAAVLASRPMPSPRSRLDFLPVILAVFLAVFESVFMSVVSTVLVR